MNDTHTPDDSADAVSSPGPGGHPAEEIAAMDPAEAPAAAERYAAELAAELEGAGGTPQEPVQLQADLDDPTGSEGVGR